MAIATSTALTIAAAAAVIGGGVSAYAVYQQGQTAKNTAKFNAKVMENEALRNEMDGRESIARRRKDNKRLMGRSRARLAKSGVVEEGTPLEVMAEVAGQMELAALDERRAVNTESQRLRTQAGISLWEGKQQARGANIQAGATLLSGAGQAAGYQAQKT